MFDIEHFQKQQGFIKLIPIESVLQEMDVSSESPEDNRLDNDFRRILCVIKQYIPYVNSNHQLALYRSWLEKLSTADHEKVERNMYLFELARQIKSNRLLPPFNNHPPSGPLRSLPKISFFRPANVENSKHDSENINTPVTSLLYPEPIYSPNDFVQENYDYPQQQFTDQNQGNINISSPMQSPYEFQKDHMQTIFMQPSAYYYYHHRCSLDEGSDTTVERIRYPTKIKKRKSKSARSLQKLSVADPKIAADKYEKTAGKTLARLKCPSSDYQENYVEKQSTVEDESSLKEDSSWCDLTDTSQTSVNYLASGDNKKSPPKIQEKEKQFSGVSKTLEQPQTPSQNKETCQNSHEKYKTNLPDEIVKISRNTQDINEVKLSLKDTNFISSDWKKTIEGLQLRLTETLNQNNELKSIINALQSKLKEETSKNKGQNDSKQKKRELHKKEIEALQQIQIDNIKKLEKSFQSKLYEVENNYLQKIEKMKSNYEIKIRELHAKHEHAKKDKDQEMFRMSEIIQQQCIRMSNEIAALRNQIQNVFSIQNDDDKIIVLQKCVSKMDKLFQRSEKEYQKQIEKLKQELDLKDKVMQIQLKTQRAELIARTSVEKQKQFDEVINKLEIKYIKMLEYHESQVMEFKEQDQEKIQQLKHLLDENNIAYDYVL